MFFEVKMWHVASQKLDGPCTILTVHFSKCTPYCSQTITKAYLKQKRNFVNSIRKLKPIWKYGLGHSAFYVIVLRFRAMFSFFPPTYVCRRFIKGVGRQNQPFPTILFIGKGFKQGYVGVFCNNASQRDERFLLEKIQFTR